MATDPLAGVIRRQRRDIRLLYRVFADDLASAFDRQMRNNDTSRLVTEADRIAIMRSVDNALDILWGRFPGDDNAAIRQITIRDTRAARYRPLDMAIRDWRQALPRTLRRRIEEEARR